MNMINILFFIYLISSFSMSEGKKKSPIIDFSNVKFKKYDIPSVMIDPDEENSNIYSFKEINIIKKRAKDFIPSPVLDSDIIVMETMMGTMKFKFYNDLAPKHCLNFKKLANSGYYDNTLFHIIIKDFLIQGGDVLSLDDNPDNDGHGGPGWTIDAEFNDVEHNLGTLSMFRSKDQNSAGSQFFITLDRFPHLDEEYTAFGDIIDGEGILKLISNMTTQYDQAISLSESKIPDNQDDNRWVEVYNPKTDQIRYCKVPDFINKNAYRDEINKKFRNYYKPSVRIIINKIRVINSNE
ncbi:MAG: hypothetical protein CMG64_02110 [Candidatus Marinimicrobia bacterium]|nr:hypothetical protein [Candidatus Neomarinimicrobiota bacterium]|tara:strand:- start:2055 stop:2939 length:885 start_codon:yes stop_codon:yes gene_type:complete